MQTPTQTLPETLMDTLMDTTMETTKNKIATQSTHRGRHVIRAPRSYSPIAGSAAGFTIVELMVVIGIILTLAGIGLTTMNLMLRRATAERTRATLHMAKGLSTEYRAVTGLIRREGRAISERHFELLHVAAVVPAQ